MIFNKANFKKIPDVPGVYLFKDKNKKVIYVGRASNLKKRVASYFIIRKNEYRRPVENFISKIKKIDYKKTRNLLEAVILEANLIKKYWPKYNVKEKDNRSFIYLAIPKSGDFPKPIIVRGREVERYKLKAEIFGPYQSLRLLRTALSLARKIFPYSVCEPNSGRPCFYYQIGLCPGTCLGLISSKEYKKNIDNLVLFFRGENKKLLNKLKKTYPKKVKSLKHVEDVALMGESKDKNYKLKANRIEGYDISHFGGKGSYGVMVVFKDGEQENSEYRLFKIKTAKIADDVGALKEVLSRRLKHKEWRYPQLMVVDGGRNQVNAVKSELEKNKLNIPVVGISKSGRHAASYAGREKLVFSKIKKSLRDLIFLSKSLIQEVRNEAHRFAIKAQRTANRKSQIANR